MPRSLDPKLVREMIHRRFKIQAAGVGLWALFDQACEDEGNRRVALLLVGACFSLWRAAFQLAAESTGDKMEKHAKKHLATVLADNAVTFGTEQATKNWTVGYYLNNAMYRLRDALDKDDDLQKSLPDAISGAPPKDIWDMSFGVFEVLLSRLKLHASTDKGRRPKRTPPAQSLSLASPSLRFSRARQLAATV